ncbi:MAG: hypothetical protein ACKVHU_18040 [Acidimicrobiales bacterium]|jgi:hypothetical protein
MAETRIILERIHHYRDTIRPYTVLIDGEKIGTVADARRSEFDVSPGQHTIRVRNYWITSPEVPIDLAPGTTTWLRTGPSGGISQAWRLFFAWSTNMFIEEIEPPE